MRNDYSHIQLPTMMSNYHIVISSTHCHGQYYERHSPNDRLI